MVSFPGYCWFFTLTHILVVDAFARCLELEISVILHILPNLPSRRLFSLYEYIMIKSNIRYVSLSGKLHQVKWKIMRFSNQKTKKSNTSIEVVLYIIYQNYALVYENDFRFPLLIFNFWIQNLSWTGIILICTLVYCFWQIIIHAGESSSTTMHHHSISKWTDLIRSLFVDISMWFWGLLFLSKLWINNQKFAI